jgi:cell division protein FtsZ
MSFSIEFAEDNLSYDARIKVIGVGGSGGNAVNTMITLGLEGVEFIAVNTDAQALQHCLAPTKIQIGQSLTRGLGAGADPDRGRKAALEDHQRLKELLQGADMIFITAGMGGGTGTGAAPVIAQLAREDDILTVGVATKPFLFEGKQRARRAEQGLAMLSEQVDTLVTIPNEKLLTLDQEDLSFIEAFRKADEVLYQAVKGISDLITQSGMVNVDFADVKTVMSSMGRALMGTGCAKGEGRARYAAELAVTSPLLDDISVEGATGVLINVVGGVDMKMREVKEAASLIQEQAHEDANIIFGATIDEHMGDAIKVTVIATGFDRHAEIPVQIVDDISSESDVAREAVAELARKSSMASPRPARPAAVPAQARTRPAPRTERVERYEEMAPASAQRRYAESPRYEQAPRSGMTAPAPRAERQQERERHFLVARDEIDWDTPAYQRRGS